MSVIAELPPTMVFGSVHPQCEPVEPQLVPVPARRAAAPLRERPLHAADTISIAASTQVLLDPVAARAAL